MLVFVQRTGSLAAWFTSCINYRPFIGTIDAVVVHADTDRTNGKLLVHLVTSVGCLKPVCTARNDYPGNDDGGQRLGRTRGSS